MGDTMWLTDVEIRSLIRLACLALVFASFARSAVVTGRVTDEAGYPLPDAAIVIREFGGNEPARQFVGRSAADGKFVIEGVPFGTYSLKASATGFVSVIFEPVQIKYPTVRWDFRLFLAPGPEGEIHSGAYLIGTIRQQGKAVPFAEICLSRGSSRLCFTANSLGEYSFTVEPGEYKATVSGGGKILWEGKLKLSEPREYRDEFCR